MGDNKFSCDCDLNDEIDNFFNDDNNKEMIQIISDIFGVFKIKLHYKLCRVFFNFEDQTSFLNKKQSTIILK